MLGFLKNLWIKLFGSGKAWQIGPIINGKNNSVNMPKTLTKFADGWGFHFPQPAQRNGHVHYVTCGYGPMKGKKTITLRYRIDMADGVEIKPLGGGSFPSILTMYFQRRGDNWSGKREFEAYRWYATFASVMPITAGEHILVAPLDGNWTAVQNSQAMYSTDKFNEALSNADRVGFVFGGNTGYGHGVFATGPATFTILGFDVN